ncbi:hypothetical protein AKJ64_00615 [candidate division MSBL1 archaeon SCGC-AAA259E17]|uniref:Uncharacterized protein n=1 Tax=candidate division MSBL1 archaeon SCGC-AAA259E17 TaxID=1698263 RepID=A0A133UGX4_9EURY|nr:hypothetical protein AKJ64_00615 [candidate division MSBL1 archaeon SCGC-AAA259E17]
MFAFIHVHHPVNKLIGGAIFAIVYVWGWNKNIASAIATHSAANSTTVFLSYIQAGTTKALGTLPLIIVLSSVLILILMNMSKVFEIGERIISAWLRLVDSLK